MYTEKIKKAIQKYREENPDLYNEYHRRYYNLKKDDEIWKDAFKSRCREASKRYRLKKLNGAEPKPRGRPRKISHTPLEETDDLLPEEISVVSNFIIELNAPFRNEIEEMPPL
jgi:hypothetical protein